MSVLIFFGMIAVWGFFMMLILWPINDSPTSESQKSTAIIATIAIAFLTEWLIKTIN